MKIDSLLGLAAKDLGLRFNLVGLLPLVLLTLFVLCLLWSGAPARAPDVALIPQAATQLDAAQGVFLALGLMAFGLLLQPLQLVFVRLLEGYWGSSVLVQAASRVGVTLQRSARQKLVRATQFEGDPRAVTPDVFENMNQAAYRLIHFYPSESRLLPTLLGNVLRAAESLPYRTYGLDAIVTWPSLYPLISADLKASLADQRNQLDLAVRMCLVFVVMAVIGTFMLFRWNWWLLIPAAALLFAWLSYRAAISAALAYGESIQSAYHLHRFDLLKALHLPLPADRESEICANQQLSDFLKGTPTNLVYQHAGK